MVTNFEHVAARPLTASVETNGGLLARAVAQLRSAICGLQGHDPLLQFTDGRMFLQCASCGHRTPGWETGDRRPRPRFAGDAARHQLQTARSRPQAG